MVKFAEVCPTAKPGEGWNNKVGKIKAEKTDMHIMIVHQYYLRKDGAGGSRWNQFAKYWSQRGHKITVLAGMLEIITAKKCPEYKGKFVVTEYEGPNIVVKRCHVSEAYNKSFVGRAWAYFSFLVSSIAAGLSVKRPDIVICTSPPLTVGLTGVILSKLKRAPMIFEVRDLWPESAIDAGVLTNKCLIKFGYWLERFSYRHAAWINVLTPAFEEVLINRKAVPAEKISMIPNGADLDIIKPGPRDNWVRQKHNLNNKFVVTYVGAHGVANALMQLIEAAKILKRKDPQVQIVLVGDGMEKPRLLEAVKQFDLDNVTLIDPVPKSQISDYLSASDVCTAVLKKCDTFKTVYPNKVFDYMCAERPIIIGIDGVARKLVEDAKAGLYVEPEDPAAFVNAVETIKTDYENMKNLAVKAREFAVKNFSRISLSEKYLEIIERQKNREDRH
jgi:glycosyltransferase involved in cell wall biosynthesis